MKTMLTHTDLVIECRDYRVPFSSCNPLFEENLTGRERLIVYTKQDLGSAGKPEDRSVCTLEFCRLPSLRRIKSVAHPFVT